MATRTVRETRIMGSLLLVIGLMLTSQVGDVDGDRYGDLFSSDVIPPTSEETAETSQPESAPGESPYGSQFNGEAGSAQPPQDQPADSQPIDDLSSGLPESGAQSPPATQQRELGATYNGPAGQEELPAEVSQGDPEQLFQDIFETTSANELPGRLITLNEALADTTFRATQTQRIEAYWDLARTVARYHLAVQEITELRTLGQSLSQPGREWELAAERAESRKDLALQRVLTAQTQLAFQLGRIVPGELPLPSDAPLCGPYNTRFEQIFPNDPPLLAEELHRLISKEYEEMVRQATAIDQARNWLVLVSERRSQQTDGAGLLKAWELYSSLRHLFVESVTRYNLNIARYSEIASPGEVGTQRLVGMLIRTDTEMQATIPDGDVRRATAESDIQEFRNPVEPTEAPSNGTERSILRNSDPIR